MSKLFKIKQWVTAQQALDFLTLQLGEEVTPLDLLQLAVERKLKISVKFDHRVPVKLGVTVPYKDVPIVELPSIREGEEKVCFLGGHCLTPEVEWDEDTPFACFEKNVSYIDGIWDLAMIGNEAINVANMLREEIGADSLDLLNIDGTFLCRPDGACANLQERFNPEDRAEGFYPAGGLPEDAVLVFRTAELNRFISEFDTPSENEKSLGSRERNTLLSVIGGLLGLMLETTPGGQKGSVYESQSAIVSALLVRHEGKAGISKPTLEAKFAAARRSLNSD